MTAVMSKHNSYGINYLAKKILINIFELYEFVDFHYIIHMTKVMAFYNFFHK